MTNFGFVINNRTCIGCHACSTACKSENDVPLGVYRTWVKYTEVGTYPDVRRNFQVTRCNHCANPPCVRICPVTAMYQRDDGIVEFDQDVCIGCKACLQACPYDAIHVDPDSGTAAKCHYCAHRTDLGLEPACVVVCPEHAILAGDLDDPDSEISRILTREPVSVRKPEQGTAPKLFYVDGNEFAMTPTAAERSPKTFLWADVITSGADGHGARVVVEGSGRQAESGAALRQAQPQAHPTSGPIQFAPGRTAEHMVQTSYNAQHEIPWHWPVPAYLVTKGIGGGLYTLLSLGILFGLFPAAGAMLAVGSLVALVFVALTTLLLVYDLERPERFLRIVFRPHWGSWLVRGAFILVAFSLLLTVHFVLEAAGHLLGGTSYDLAVAARPWALGIGLPLAVGTTVYTAFLFGQAEGRDLWQSTLLPAHLLVQGLMVGSGALLVLGSFVPLSAEAISVATAFFGTSVILDLLMTLMGEFGMPHASEVAATAAHEISRGRYSAHFWIGSIVIGHIVPLIALFVAPVLLPGGAMAAVIGLYFYEYAFVMAPQEVPNS